MRVRLRVRVGARVRVRIRALGLGLGLGLTCRPASDVTSSMSVAALFLETSEARMGVRKPSRSRKPRAKAW